MEKMKLWENVFGKLLVVFAIAGFILFVYYYPTPHDQTIKIWTPANYHIDNPAIKNGQYAPIDEVRVGGTAIYLSFTEYQQYQNRKKPKDNAVMIQKDGTVFYQIKESAKNYVTKTSYGSTYLLDAKVTKITGDTINISQERNAGEIIEMTFIGLLSLDLIISGILAGIMVVIITIINYLKKASGRKVAA